MNKISLISCTVALGAVASMASADTVLTYGTAGSSYTQNFNGLANTGSSNSWSNSSSTPTLSGWNAWQRNTAGSAGIRDATDTTQVSTYNANNGSNNTIGGLQSYGASSSTDRALGTLNTNATGDLGITLAIKNTTGTALNSFTFAWVLEQWRDGGNNPAATQNMVVDYKVTAITSTTSLAEGLNYLNNIAYTTGFSTLRTATSPIASTTAAALDGNLSANRVTYTNTINSINWANNTVLVIRFWDDNHTGNDHGFGIDDVTFSAVPAPGAAALVGLAGLITTRRRK